MRNCTRPHCAIRSHNHEVTFADFLELDDYYRNISRSFINDDKKNIDNYKLLSDNLSKYNSRTCLRILKEMVDYVNNEQNLDFRKLKALYIFSTCRTLHMIKFIHTEKSKLKESIYGAYDRLLKVDDQRFVLEMEKLVLY